MAESQDHDDELGLTPGYKPPAQKSLAEIANQDAEDESLRRYKETLLGKVDVGSLPCGGKKVTVESLSVLVDGREDIELKLTGDLSELKDSPIVMKEGTHYRLKLQFRCHGEIVPGLRFVTTLHRKGLKVDAVSYMVGSYGPSGADQSPHQFTTPEDVAPQGMIARGRYTAKSTFVDDDENKYLSWQWILDIKKHWPGEKD